MISMLSSTDVTGRNVSRQNSLKRQLIRVHTRHSGRVSKRGNEKLLPDAPPCTSFHQYLCKTALRHGRLNGLPKHLRHVRL